MKPSDQLRARGYVVVRLYAAGEAAALAEQFEAELAANPLIRPEHRADYVAKPALSSFGALSDAWTMHMPVQRRVRAAVHAWVAANLGDFGKTNFYVHPDRAMVRVPGTSLGGETAHRDQHPAAAQERGDITFGGWVSLAGEQQLSCVPGTHRARFGGQEGFLKLSAAEQRALKDQRAFERVSVPPGHALLFYQHLVHEVRPGKIRARLLRVFHGVVLTDQVDPYTPYARGGVDVVRDFAPFALPSGQIPRMWEKLHAVNWKDRLRAYSAWWVATIRRTDLGYVPYECPPLRELLPERLLPPPYTREELAHIYPIPFASPGTPYFDEFGEPVFLIELIRALPEE